MDILYVRSLFRPADLGGNRYPWEVTRRLAARGHRVRVVTPRPAGPLPAPTRAELCTYPVSRRTSIETFATNALFSHLRVEREIQRRRPALIVLSSYEVAFGNFVLPGRARRLPSVFIYHSRLFSDWVERARAASGGSGMLGRALGAFSGVVERTVLRSSGTVIAVSPFSMSEIHERAGRALDVTLVPTGVDTDTFQPGDRVAARRSLGYPPDARLLITVGRLAPVKRYDRAIRTLAILRKQDPRFRLMLVGDGPEMPALRELASDLGLDDAVRFEGFRDGDDLVRRLRAADLELCTSEFENWSLAILESLAVGIPVVGVPRGGIGQILSDVDRRLLADGDSPDEIATVVRALERDPGLIASIAARGSDYVRARFGWESVISQIEDVFARSAT